MYSLIPHGRRLVQLQKWRYLSVPVMLFQNSSAFSSSFSSATAIADVSPREFRKVQLFTISHLVDSLGLSRKLAESISRKVNFGKKGNPDSVLNLLRSHGFTDSQISSIFTAYPKLLIADAEKSIGPKLEFLRSREASTFEFTEVVSTVPKILVKKEGKTIGAYYDIVKEIIEADKSSKFDKLSLSLPQGSNLENKIKNISLLRDLGVPQKNLFSMLFSNFSPVCGKERFEESLKKVVEMGFDPKTSKFVEALEVVQCLSDKTIEEKVNVFKTLGFDVGDVWALFKKWPPFLALSEKNMLKSIETFIGLGFSRDEFAMMVKSFPQCIALSAESVKKKTEFLVKQMNWPLKAMVLFPQVFGLSMEKRIVPRCNVIKALMSKGLLVSEIPPMTSVMTGTDKEFLDRYVNKHNDKQLVPELMAIFNGDRES